MALVSVTRLRLRSFLYLPLFSWYALPSFRQAIAAPGNRFTQTHQQGLTTFWTLTIWDDEASMRRYMRSGTHGKAMPKLALWCDEASTVHWQQDHVEPDWQEAQQRMASQGRPYPVKYPSANQRLASSRYES